jgi:hypothetical protein
VKIFKKIIASVPAVFRPKQYPKHGIHVDSASLNMYEQGCVCIDNLKNMSSNQNTNKKMPMQHLGKWLFYHSRPTLLFSLYVVTQVFQKPSKMSPKNLAKKMRFWLKKVFAVFAKKYHNIGFL